MVGALVRAAAAQSVWHTKQEVAKLLLRLAAADDQPASSQRAMTASSTKIE